MCAYAGWLYLTPCRLQSANILVDQDGVAKLADFGCSTHASNDIQAKVVGTPYFMAPELLTERTIAPPIDIWALGCTGTWRRCAGRLVSICHAHDVLGSLHQ